MKTRINVLIGIQARSTSTRFPNKINAQIGDKTMLEWVYEACLNSQKYLTKYPNRYYIDPIIALLVPENDPLEHQYAGRIKIVTGPEHDVLTRYIKAAKRYNSDFITRITSDCPRIPPWMISKTIISAVNGDWDFLSNAYPDTRTTIDGTDCEVLSRRLLTHLDAAASAAEEREHVTLRAVKDPPSWAKTATLLGHTDFSHMKNSVDTPEDLQDVLEKDKILQQKIDIAEKRHGRTGVVRI